MKQKALVIFVLVFSLTLAACSNGRIVTTPSIDYLASIPAVGLAQKALADQLGVKLEDVKVDKAEETTWPDSCLGMGGPNESCLTVETKGYLMQFTAGGKSCEVRTNQDGTVIKTNCPTP